MSDIVKILPYCVDLGDTLSKTELHTLFVMSESLAHRFEIEIKCGGKDVDLSGRTVTASFTNFRENTTIEMTGEVKDGKAVVTLEGPCYTLRGQFVLIVMIKDGDADVAVFLGEGHMRTSRAENIIYDDYIVMDADALLAHIAAMKSATDRANTAADRVERMQIDASGLAGDANRLGGKPLEAFFAVNLLDNSDWRMKENIVNQRGKTSYTGSGYTIDRWESWGTDVVTTIENGCLSITSPQAHGILQKVDGDYTGKVLTLAVCDSDGNVKCNSATVPAKTTTTQYMFAVNFGSCAIYLYVTPQGLLTVQFNVANNSTFRAKWVALYEGSYTADTLPPYVPKGYGAELAECQRYFVRINAERDTGYSILCWGLAEGESVFYPQLAVPINMRKGVVASIVHSSGCRGYYLNASGGAATSEIINIESKSGVATGSITLTVTVSGAPFTKGMHAAIQLPSYGYIDISKDL